MIKVSVENTIIATVMTQGSATLGAISVTQGLPKGSTLARIEMGEEFTTFYFAHPDFQEAKSVEQAITYLIKYPEPKSKDHTVTDAKP